MKKIFLFTLSIAFSLTIIAQNSNLTIFSENGNPFFLILESDKLEYAKFAYNYCIDKNNYWEINDVFNFSSSVDKLNEYISTK